MAKRKMLPKGFEQVVEAVNESWIREEILLTNY